MSLLSLKKKHMSLL